MTIDAKGLEKYLAFNEGIRMKRYYDSKGYPTIGGGFNLVRKGPREAIEAVGGNFARVKSGQESLTESQAGALLEPDARPAIGIARDLFPDFNQYAAVRQLVLADLAFNLGGGRSFRNSRGFYLPPRKTIGTARRMICASPNGSPNWVSVP